MNAVQTQALSFCHNTAEVPALEGVSLTVGAGELVMLMGSSGSGKTTLLRLMKKGLEPLGSISGEISVSSEKVGYVPQSPEDSFVSDTVRGEIMFAAENAGLPAHEVRRLTAETVSCFGLGRLMGRKLSELSGGEKQLVSLCAVMVIQPDILLLDEPFSRLDPLAAASLASLVLRVNREFGTTVIIAEHNSEYLFADCDKVIFLEKGRLTCALPPHEAAKHPAMRELIPAAARAFAGHEPLPLTVREGRAMLAGLSCAEEVPLPKSPEFTETVLTAEGLYLSFSRGGEDVLSGAGLVLHKGESLALMGANGSGKTTLLRVLAGLARPYAGKILIGGKPPKKAALVTAMLPQEAADLFLQPSVIEDYRTALKAMGKPESNAESMLEKLGCTHLGGMHPYDLSGGELQLCALGRVLLCEPDILLLDEPTKGLDPVSAKRVGQLIRRLCAGGMAVLTVTHDTELAAEFSDSCGIFCGGRVESLMPTPEFFSCAGLLNTAAGNIARGRIKNAYTPEHIRTALGGERHVR